MNSTRGTRPLTGLLMANTSMALIMLALPWVRAGVGMAGVLLVAGFAFGPAQVFWLELIDILRPRGTAVSALGFLWMVEGFATAIGSAVAGRLADASGATPALLLVSIAAFGSPLVLVAFRRTLRTAAAGAVRARVEPAEPLPVAG